MKFSFRDLFGKCGEIHSFLRVLSRLLKKSSMENFIFRAVIIHYISDNDVQPKLYNRN